VVCLPTPWDVVRLAKETGEDPYRFLTFVKPGEISEVPKSDPTWLFVNGERYMMGLRRTKTGCHFLDKRTGFCKAYESRPILCRLYPLALHETRAGAFKGFTVHTDVECPRSRDGVVETPRLYQLYLQDYRHQEDYEDLVSVFNRQKDLRRKPADFIKMFYVKK
jgi:Fe-S-cluster containining protein